jgi:dienelactone hydrolase
MRTRVLLSLLAVTVFPCAAWAADADRSPLPGTAPLTLEGDIASQLVDGADAFLLRRIEASVAERAKHWRRDLSSREAYDRSIEPNRQRLAHVLGVRDPRVPFDGLELLDTTARPALVGRGEGYEIFAVRWPAFADVYGEGLLLEPTGRKPLAQIVAVPHCDQTPEMLCGLVEGIAPESQFARRLAESGCRVVVPMLIDRSEKTRGITNREWIYRAAFELGRGLGGYEVNKVLAVVDWFAKQGAGPIGVVGYGDGGMLALYAAALDPRINAACVSGYFDNRNRMWEGPLDRNVFALLEQFGDAELAAMIAPRALVVEASAAPESKREGGAGGPFVIVTPKLETVAAEVARTRPLVEGLPNNQGIELIATRSAGAAADDGRGPFGTDVAIARILERLVPGAKLSPQGKPPTRLAKDFDPAARHARQMHELERHNQQLLRDSAAIRRQFITDKLDVASIEAYQRSVEPFRKLFYDEVIGRFDNEVLPPKARSRRFAESERWTQYEVVLDVFDGVIAYGILTLPKGIAAGERRPVVVCQHGLEGRPQDVIGEPVYAAYKAFATQLADRGFITFAPQNLYIFRDRFRTLQRKGNPIKKTLFSIIVPQHQQIVDWLQTLPQVDPARVAFYGLSYGGKTAMRVPPLVTDYCLSICSADFNEWVDKNAAIDNPRSYMRTGEYEIFEFDLGSTFNYAEMAALIAPRPFMVERGHADGVADDWTVAWEYAKVRLLYSRLKIPGQTEIEWFDGPHTINGQGTFDFLHRHLNWPKPK